MSTTKYDGYLVFRFADQEISLNRFRFDRTCYDNNVVVLSDLSLENWFNGSKIFKFNATFVLTCDDFSKSMNNAPN